MRCNVGIHPRLLTDQFLIAEYREIPMLIGSLKYWNWKIKSEIPSIFNLGVGHMNFLKNKLIYCKRRHEEVKNEMRNRNFFCDTLSMDFNGIPEEFCNDWQPNLDDSKKLRFRLKWKLQAKNPFFWRYYHKKLNPIELNELILKVENGELFYV